MASDTKGKVEAAGGTCQPACPFCNPFFVGTFFLGLWFMTMEDRSMHYLGVIIILVAYAIPLLSSRKTCG